jgi:hypothetical protein
MCSLQNVYLGKENANAKIPNLFLGRVPEWNPGFNDRGVSRRPCGDRVWACRTDPPRLCCPPGRGVGRKRVFGDLECVRQKFSVSDLPLPFVELLGPQRPLPLLQLTFPLPFIQLFRPDTDSLKVSALNIRTI